MKICNHTVTLPPGYELVESGAPRGERRWFHLTKIDPVVNDRRLVFECSSLRVMLRRIERERTFWLIADDLVKECCKEGTVPQISWGFRDFAVEAMSRGWQMSGISLEAAQRALKARK